MQYILAALKAIAAIPEIVKLLRELVEKVAESVEEQRRLRMIEQFKSGLKDAGAMGDTSKLEEAWKFGRVVTATHSGEVHKPDAGLQP